VADHLLERDRIMDRTMGLMANPETRNLRVKACLRSRLRKLVCAPGHPRLEAAKKDVDARAERGHDEKGRLKPSRSLVDASIFEHRPSSSTS
jgi:hypothetical protein